MLQRSAWLTRPWFFVAVAVLALNDHVFKHLWPGWFTGKLSDFAGLVVVATIASALLGARWGTVLAGLAFLALKVVPGVAEVAAPLMGGGVTLRDASDLLALVVLPPLGFVLVRSRPEQQARNRRAWALVGLFAAVLATTATSQGPPRYVSLGASDGVIYAEVDPGDGFSWVLLGTTDGGVTWVDMTDRTGGTRPIDIAREARYVDGSTQACAADSTCYRIRQDEAPDARAQLIERSVQGSAMWRRDGELPYPRTSANDIAVDPADASRAVVVLRDRTIVRRVAAGDWAEVDLAPLAGPPQWQRELVAALGNRGTPVAACLLAAVMIGLVAPWRGAKIGLHVVNGLVWIVLQLAAMLFTRVGILQVNATWLGIVAVMVGSMRLAWWAQRRSVAPPEPTTLGPAPLNRK